MEDANVAIGYTERTFHAAPGIDLYWRDYPAAAAGSAIPLICLHGYWRTCRDFDALAAHVSATRRVITPDLRGRGRSSRSDDIADYEIEKLVADVSGMLASLGIGRAVFLGTALGAQIGMLLATQQPDLVAGLIMNDSAPEIDKEAAARAAGFSGGAEVTFEQALEKIRAQNEASFTRYGDEQWLRMTHRAYWPVGNGNYVRDFDQRTNQVIPKISQTYPSFWPMFDSVAAPILVLRGENSDHVSLQMIERMQVAQPTADIVTIPGCGHPPMLWEPESFAAIDAFLAKSGIV